jgi:putative transposase
MSTAVLPSVAKAPDGRVPDPEVPERPTRRRFSAEYKLAIVKEADAATEPGEVGALLRREGLYSSHLVDWRRQRDAGALDALSTKRGRPRPDPREREIAALRRDNARLRRRLDTAERIIEVQGKSQSCWGSRSTQRATRPRAIDDGRCSRSGSWGGRRARRAGRGPVAGHGVPPDRPPRGGQACVIPPRSRPRPPRALSQAEERSVIEVLHSERFCDVAPAEVVATLLDEGTYLCSERTMYRLLAKNGEVRERRDQLRHPAYARPELLATGPNEVWSWDTTKLLGPAKWTYYYLLVILDCFSRYAVGWCLAHRETAQIAERLIAATIAKYDLDPELLTIHADRGSSQASKPVAFLLADLGITKSHSRPHTSNDNPYSEAQFKTMKYRPTFPGRFGSMLEARAFCREFFSWYNESHRHSGIGFMTPEAVYFGRAAELRDHRAKVLDAAFAAHPERFVLRPPVPPKVPTAVWINKPEEREEVAQ